MKEHIAHRLKKMSFGYIFCLFLISSCGGSQYSDAGKAVADSFGANEVKVTMIKTTNGIPRMDLAIIDPAVPDGYAIERIQSTGSLILYRNLPENVNEECEMYEVTVTQGGKSEFRNYSITELKRADQAVFNAAVLLEWDTSRGILDAVPVVDNEFISDSMLWNVSNLLHELDSAGGKPVKRIVTGFRPDKFKESGEDVTVVWGEIQREKSLDEFVFYVRASNGRVVYMEVN
jgi:hypothetical protein